MKKLLILSLILAGTTSLMAKDVSSTTKIIKLYSYEDGAVIKLEEAASNNSSCSYSGAGQFMSLRFDTEGSKILYSALLSAFVSDSKVRIASDGCDNIWGNNKTMNKLYRVELRK